MPPGFRRFRDVGLKLRVLGLFLLAIAPSAWLAWNWRAMPQLGFYHDDSINWVSAKSIAQGDGYRIASLPQQPWQTKYPPLFAALLAVVWKLNPVFPGNLPLATLLVWLMLPVFVLLVRAVLRQFGFGERETWILTFAAALNPFTATLGMSLMPELLFTSLFLGSILLAERSLRAEAPGWLAGIAGLLAGAAYLTKSAALPLLITAPLCFALRKQWRRGLLFAGAMLPAVAGWQVWATLHASRGQDLVTLYYTNYLGFQIYNVGLSDLPRVVWFNLDAFLRGVGRLLTFDTAIGESVHLERIVAIAAIAGAVRLVRRSGRMQYAAAAIPMTGILLIWHYQPDQRFVFPLYPLLAAGLWTELRNVWDALRRAWRKRVTSERVAAGVGATLLASLAGLIAFAHLYGDFVFLPEVMTAYRGDLKAIRPVYSWIGSHTSSQATFYAYDDPLVYLYTGRRSCGLPIPPKLYFHEDEAGIDRVLRNLPSFSQEQGLDFMLLTRRDFYRDLHEKRARMLLQTIAGDTRFEPVYEKPAIVVYRRTEAAIASQAPGAGAR